MSMISRLVGFGAVGVLLALLAACSAHNETRRFGAASEPVIVSEHLTKAQTHFLSGNFGLAVRKYKIAVEEKPDDVEAWLGLAASYDKLKRFDLADKTYNRVTELAGETPAVLNNIGYSYLLRGDLDRARKKIEAAYVRDPDDPTIRQNVELLNRELAKRSS